MVWFSTGVNQLLDELAACLDGMSAMEWPGSTILSISIIISKKMNQHHCKDHHYDEHHPDHHCAVTGVRGVGTTTLKQQSSEQWKTSHSSGSLLLLPIVILFLISCWINSAPLHDEFSFRVTKAHTVEDGQLLEKLFI